MIRVTQAWLTKQCACADGKAHVKAYGTTEAVPMLRRLIADGKLEWANWLLVRVMTRQAIDAAKACLKKNTTKNRAAAWAASEAASAVARAAAS